MKSKLMRLGLILICAATIAYSMQTIAASEPVNNDATLAEIKVNDVSLKDFKPEIQTYKIMLESGQKAIPEVSAKTNDPGSLVSIEPATHLPGGTVITVTARDGTKITYIILFNLPEDTKMSSDASLCEIRVDGQLLKDFQPIKQNYKLELASEETRVPEITAAANSEKASIEISNAASLPGKTRVTVWAESGASMTYTVEFSVLTKSIETAKKDVVQYDFENIEVVYAAEFTAVPFQVDQSSWLTDIAGDLDNFVKVTSGVVSMKTGQGGWMEEFIQFEGLGGSERFLVNSRGFEYYEGTNKVKTIKSQYWSAKQIQGSAVVKDFNGPIKSVVMWREFDEKQNMTAVRIACYIDYGATNQHIYLERPDSNYYKGSMDTLKYEGTPIIFYN